MGLAITGAFPHHGSDAAATSSHSSRCGVHPMMLTRCHERLLRGSRAQLPVWRRLDSQAQPPVVHPGRAGSSCWLEAQARFARRALCLVRILVTVRDSPKLLLRTRHFPTIVLMMFAYGPRPHPQRNLNSAFQRRKIKNKSKPKQNQSEAILEYRSFLRFGQHFRYFSSLHWCTMVA